MAASDLEWGWSFWGPLIIAFLIGGLVSLVVIAAPIVQEVVKERDEAVARFEGCAAGRSVYDE